MPGEIFTFNKQLDIGSRGETLFLKHYADKASKADGRKYDLFYEGKTVELKTDTYPMQKTENFFMERYGSIEDKKVGGPWRARDDKVDYFVYFFVANKVFFWFETEPLVKYLDIITPTMRGKTVPNRTYSSLGFAVARESLRHLMIREDKF